ncbi:hypothetical protein [Empedobacter falsenii]|uniref:hypothetical protein n=1 Tax=Empedobacter falsenii TaxID=343874 RepID=UPI0021AADDEC|nr:hypothetical protein [Empedobacter falsenii]
MLIIRYLSFILLLTSISGLAQQLIDPQLRLPVEKAIESSYELKNKQLEVEKNNYQYDEVKGKRQPNLSAIALGGYLNSNGIIDIPTKSIDILSTELFSGNQNSIPQQDYLLSELTLLKLYFRDYKFQMH